jgi:glyoxylase-like metal-dependent hydrolase (beta-lactamase superfamily II)
MTLSRESTLPPSIHTLRDTPTSPTTYLLRHPKGVIVFGTRADLSAHEGLLRELGPVTHILLSDRHHVSEHTVRFAQTCGVPLSASKSEAAAVKPLVVANILPYQRFEVIPGLLAIPTPGHTRGAFSYLWTEAGRKFLFVGDTLVPIDGRWEFWVTQRNRAQMRESMQELAALEFDVILSNSFAAKPHAWREMDVAGRAAMFDDVLTRLSD